MHGEMFSTSRVRWISILLLPCCLSLVTSIEISPCARWNKTGVTVAGTGTSGSSSEQLNWPLGIFIHRQTNALYVADSQNNRVQTFDLSGASSLGRTVAANVSEPAGVYIDEENGEPVMYIALSGANRVERWTKGAMSGVQVGGPCRTCSGVWLDREKNVYMAEETGFCVKKWSPATGETVVAAGQEDKDGHTDDLLDVIGGIYVHPTDSTVYVADRLNNRIQKWKKGASAGTTVAGWSNGTEGEDAGSVNNPFDVVVDDETGVVCVADTFNSRVQRWLPNALEGETIAGGFGLGNAPNQLDSPSSLTFDSDGNLYVSDSLNHRIQQYKLLDNARCSSAPAEFFSTLRLLPIIIPLLSFFLSQSIV